jgi:hypothetical protein
MLLRRHSTTLAGGRHSATLGNAVRTRQLTPRQTIFCKAGFPD